MAESCSYSVAQLPNQSGSLRGSEIPPAAQGAAEAEGEEHHPVPGSPTPQRESPSGGTHCCSSLAHFTDDSGMRKHTLSPLMK